MSFSVCVTYSELDLKEFKTRNKVIMQTMIFIMEYYLMKILDYEQKTSKLKNQFAQPGFRAADKRG